MRTRKSASETLQPFIDGHYLLIMNFRSKYTQDGEERYFATTFFAPTDARRAFPCWDEPAIKATFDIKVSAPRNRVVLSNMPLIEESQDKEDPIAYRYIFKVFYFFLDEISFFW